MGNLECHIRITKSATNGYKLGQGSVRDFFGNGRVEWFRSDTAEFVRITSARSCGHSEAVGVAIANCRIPPERERIAVRAAA